jgi:hypothetical protein
VVGGLLLLALIVIVAVFFYRRRRQESVKAAAQLSGHSMENPLYMDQLNSVYDSMPRPTGSIRGGPSVAKPIEPVGNPLYSISPRAALESASNPVYGLDSTAFEAGAGTYDDVRPLQTGSRSYDQALAYGDRNKSYMAVNAGGRSAGYMDVAPDRSAGYMDVAPEPGPGYMDVAAEPGVEGEYSELRALPPISGSLKSEPTYDVAQTGGSSELPAGSAGQREQAYDEVQGSAKGDKDAGYYTVAGMRGVAPQPVYDTAGLQNGGYAEVPRVAHDGADGGSVPVAAPQPVYDTAGTDGGYLPVAAAQPLSADGGHLPATRGNAGESAGFERDGGYLPVTRVGVDGASSMMGERDGGYLPVTRAPVAVTDGDYISVTKRALDGATASSESRS